MTTPPGPDTRPSGPPVDTCGLLLAVLVTGAHVQDRDAARPGVPSATTSDCPLITPR